MSRSRSTIRVFLAVSCGAVLAVGCEDEWSAPPEEAESAAHSPEVLDPSALPGRYALILRAGATEAQVTTLAASHQLTLEELDPAAGLALLTGRAQDETLPLLDALGSEELVEWAEPDIAVQLDLQPDDWKPPMWAFHNTGINDGIEGADISAFNAWDETLGAGVVVALVDSGVDSGHSDLGDRLWVNPGEIAGNGIDDDGNGYVDDLNGWDFARKDAVPDDELGHGSSVAGVLVGRGNDGAGIFGTAWGARLMAVKAMAPEQDGNHSAFAVARALRYAADNGARVVAAPLSTEGRSRVMEEAARHVDTKGVVLVTSAGNASRDLDEEPLFPACLDLAHALVVTASDNRDQLSRWSGYGPGCVDLAAPGEKIITAYKTGEDGNNRYGSFSGTSMSVPFVAGAAALAWSVAPQLETDEVVLAIRTGVSPLEEGADRVGSGGRLDLEGTVNNALGLGEIDADDRAECVPAGLIACGQTVGLDSSDGDAATTDAMDDYPCKIGNYRGAEASWEFTALSDGEHRWRLVDPVPTELDNDVFVLAADDGVCRAASCLDEGGYGPNEVAFEAEAGSSFYLVVDGFNGDVGPFEAQLICPD